MGITTPLRILGLLASAAVTAMLCGCANFSAISSFASEGNKVSALVKSDFDSMRASCKTLRARQDLLNQALKTDQGDSKNFCDTLERGLPALAKVTFELIDGYHEALGKLANGESWSLKKDLEGLGGALKGIKDRDGPLLKGADVDRYTTAAVTIVDALLSVARERAARQLLEKDLPWAEVLAPLRIWYGAEGPSDERNAHAGACRYLSDTWGGFSKRANVLVTCNIDKRCEPVKGMELVTEADAAQKPFAKCVPASPGQTSERAKAAVATIDAWLQANDELRKNAFKPDAQTLVAGLRVLRDRREALEKAFNPD